MYVCVCTYVCMYVKSEPPVFKNNQIYPLQSRMYVCVYVCMYIDDQRLLANPLWLQITRFTPCQSLMYTYIHTYIHIHTCSRYVCTNSSSHNSCIYARMHAFVHIHPCIHKYVHTYTYLLSVCLHKLLITQLPRLPISIKANHSGPIQLTRAYVCMYVCMYVCVYYVCIHHPTYKCLYMYVCVCVCIMYVYTHARSTVG